MKPLSSEELIKLKEGDVIYLETELTPSPLKVLKVGSKFITFSNTKTKVNIRTCKSHWPSYPYSERYVYRSEEDIQKANEHYRQIDEARDYLRKSLFSMSSSTLLKVYEMVKAEIEKEA